MTASERFRRYLAGEEVDRCPAIKWAPWWNMTLVLLLYEYCHKATHKNVEITPCPVFSKIN